MAVIQKGTSTPEMNMTPLIDVTFQLIIFFMLVNNIIAEENVEMIIPDLMTPQTRELGEGESRVTINLSPLPFVRKDRTTGQPLNFEGAVAFVQIGIDKFGTDQLDAIAAALKEAKARNPNVEVLLRGDAALYYQEVQPIMDAINAAGISTVNLVAAMPQGEGAPGSTPGSAPGSGSTDTGVGEAEGGDTGGP